MLKIYGSLLCPDCAECCADLEQTGIEYTFCDFSESLLYLKEFLSIRDSSDLFAEVRKNGQIGIPCIVREDGSHTLDWTEYVSQTEA